MKRAVVAFMAAILCQGAFAEVKTQITVVDNNAKSTVYNVDEDGYITFAEKSLLIKENRDKKTPVELKLADVSKLLVKEITGVDNTLSESQSISLYPNPASSEVFVSGIDGKQMVEIFSISGVLVKKVSVENGSAINISDLRQGVYIMKVDGKTVKLCKI
ncbi:MAG: T9SS type A sorting domain-containing protein [Paludibacteraceae bacterium]|nr:T9SS type A sorting domain-containing protein [Paludibacteraceae bacterium]